MQRIRLVSRVSAAGLVAVFLIACQWTGSPTVQRATTLPPAAQDTPRPGALRVVTLNAGSGRSVEGADAGNAGYGPAQSAIADRWYGNGLAWPAVISDVAAFFAETDADIVALQEVFHTSRCADIPAAKRLGFICEDWMPGDPTVAQRILGDGYQVACHPGKPDKCLAVHRRLGNIEGCAAGFCLDGLQGLDGDDCGAGNRVAAATVRLKAGGALRVVHMHGTSGVAPADARCRRGQVDAIFAEGAAAPDVGLVLGDFNTDPARARWLDVSARALQRYTMPPGQYRFVTDIGLFVAPTFLSFLNIDHVLAAGLQGQCRAAGRTPGTSSVSDIVYLDHTAIVCDLQPRD